jgi:hypothetical protein
LSRWRGKGSSSEEEPAGSELVVPGSIRSPDETDALVVTLSITDQEITMHADGAEIGKWHLSAVKIEPIDTTSFDFIAEGDRLIFSPDDPSAFAIIPLVGGTVDEKGPRRSRKRRKKPDESVSIEPASATKQKSPIVSNEPPAVHEKPPRVRRRRKPDPKKTAPAKGSTEAAPNKSEEKRNGVWIRTLDAARRYDVLGLDRVPIDEDLRGEKHQHTWDHRVAATSGPGKHICTICGKIRL